MFQHVKDAVHIEWCDTLNNPALVEGNHLMGLNVVMATPPFAQQWAHVQAMTLLESETALERDRIEALTRQKCGIRQKLLTGRWRVPLNPSDPPPANQTRRPSMLNKNNYWAQLRPDGKWESKHDIQENDPFPPKVWPMGVSTKEGLNKWM